MSEIENNKSDIEKTESTDSLSGEEIKIRDKDDVRDLNDIYEIDNKLNIYLKSDCIFFETLYQTGFR